MYIHRERPMDNLSLKSAIKDYWFPTLGQLNLTFLTRTGFILVGIFSLIISHGWFKAILFMCAVRVFFVQDDEFLGSE
jgi:hypothetical protein